MFCISLVRGELLRIVVGVVYYELLRALSPALKKLIFQRRLKHVLLCFVYIYRQNKVLQE